VDTMTHTQAIQRAGQRELRELLRSRSVRLLLAGVALAQGVAVVERVETKQAQSAAAQISRFSPMVVTGVEPVEKDVELALNDVELEEAGSDAEALAERYEREGYKVSRELARTIHDAAVESGVDPEVAFGLVRAESGFRNSATSPVGAVGLTQLMPKTAAWLEPGVTRKELRDPETNLRIGFKYLSKLIKKYDGNERLALVAYNRGPGTVDRALKRGQDPDNGYADFVHGKKNHGHTLYSSGSKKKRSR
jgi:soluble lytic murein transglycosylase-like protein